MHCGRNDVAVPRATVNIPPLVLLDYKSRHKDPRKEGLSVPASFCLSNCFVGIRSLVFCNIWHGARNPYENVCDRAKCLGKFFVQRFLKISFLNLRKIWNWLLLNLFCNKNLCYLVCSCTNLIFLKNLIPAIWIKMLLVNHVTRFCNKTYLLNKLMM